MGQSALKADLWSDTVIELDVFASNRSRSTQPLHQTTGHSRDASFSLSYAMDFTQIYKQSAGLVAFSAGAHWILCAAHDHLIVRRADKLQITRSWLVDTSPSATIASFGKANTTSSGSAASSQDASITHIGWSCDSEYILAACAKRGVVNVYKMRDDAWTARIEAGAEGLTRAEWAPDGLTIVCFSEWGVSTL